MNDAPRPRPNLSRRGLVAAGVTALLLVVFYRIHDALLPFIVAVAVAFVLDPLIVWLQPRLGGKRWVAAALVFVLLLLFLAGFGYWVGSLVSAELTGLAKDGPKMLHDLTEQVIGRGGISIFGTTYTADMLISRLQASFAAWMGPNGFSRVGALGLEVILGTFLTLVLVPYLLISGPLVARGVIWLLPPARRGAVERELPRVIPVLRRYIIGVVVVVTVTALIAWIGLGLIFHVANAALLSLAVGVLEIIPALGPFASMVLIGLAALQEHDVTKVVLLMGFAIFLRLVIDNGVGPVVLGRSAQLHPVAVIFAFVVGGTLLGVTGLLLAVPVAATVVIVLEDRYARDRC